MKKYLIAPLGLLIGSAIHPTAFAVEGDYFSPSIAIPFSDAERESDRDYAAHMMFGHSLSGEWNIELGLQGNKFIRDDSSAEYTQHSLNVDMLYFPFGKGVTSPYVMFGAGYLRTNFDGDAYANGMTNYGVGVFHDAGEPGQWMWRAGLTLRQDYDSHSAKGLAYFQDAVITLGGVYVFHNDVRWNRILADRAERLRRAQASAAAAKPAVIPREPVLEGGNSVCALAGGICGASGNPSFTIQFDVDSSMLSEEALSELDRVVGYMKAFPDLKAQIIGHTDITGGETADYNKWLSDRRAFRVHGYLHEKGVYPGRLKVQGYGQSQPVTANVSEDHRAKNRRVEIRLYR